MRTAVVCGLAIIFLACHDINVKNDRSLVPYPAELAWQEGNFTLQKGMEIRYQDASLQKAMEYLQQVVADATGLQLQLKQEEEARNGIYFEIDSTMGQKDRYRLLVSDDGIRVEAATPRSALLAVQTLHQLLPLEANGESIRIPAVTIADQPFWEWRGMMLDVSRHFWNKEEVKRFLDMMAYYKFNKFHWHLTDDQGWRIEIKKYPLLTEQGAWRLYNNHDRGCISLSDKESNPDYAIPREKLRPVGDTVVYGGFYTQEDIREIVAYAGDRGIDVIPEIDMPGHFTSAIASYPEITCFGKAGWGTTFSAPLCPGKEQALEFCKNVFAEVFQLFPYHYVHVGGDEVEKANWIKCPDCQARMRREKLKDEKELQSWFIRQMESFFHAHGKEMIGWDEIIEGGLSESAIVMWWRTWAGNAVQIATAQGNEVVLTPNSHFYFDYKQDHSTLRKLYEFNPVPKGLTPGQRALIKGVQANTWAEWIPSFERLEYLTVPRIAALSELAWRSDTARHWEEFYPRLLQQFKYWDMKGVNYRPLDLNNVNTVNSFVGEAKVKWEYDLPEVEIRYTTDGSIPDRSSALYTGPFKLNETTDFTIRFFRPDGSAADIVKTRYKKEEYRPGVKVEQEKTGLQCEWHEAVINKCETMDELPVRQTYIVEQIEVPEGVNGKRALCFTGYLNIAEEGIYTFSLASDDGSKLLIAGEVVVDNDGPHGPTELKGQMALGKGLHPLKLYYFDMNNGGFISLKLFNADGKEIPLNQDNLRY